MAAGLRDVDRRWMFGILVAAHAPRGHRLARSDLLRTGTTPRRYAARTRARPCEPRIHSWRQLRDRLDRVRDTDARIPLWTTTIARRSLWRAGVAVHLGADRADDLQRLSGSALSGALPEHRLGGRNRGVRLVHA